MPAEPCFPYLCVFVPSFCLSSANKQGRFCVVILVAFVIINNVSFVDPNSPTLPLTLTGGLVSRIRMMSSAVRASTDKCCVCFCFLSPTETMTVSLFTFREGQRENVSEHDLVSKSCIGLFTHCSYCFELLVRQNKIVYVSFTAKVKCLKSLKFHKETISSFVFTKTAFIWSNLH